MRSSLHRFQPGYLGLVFIVALLTTGLAGALTELLVDKEAWAQSRLEQADTQVRANLLALGWRPVAGAQGPHGVEVLEATQAFEAPSPHGTLRGGAPTDDQRKRAVRVLEQELSIYPPEFLRQSGLRRIVLTSGLTEDGRVIPSLPNYHRTLILDPNAGASYLRRLVHHELFHFIDYSDDHIVRTDAEWNELNDKEFLYGEGGRHLRTPGAAQLRADLPGFLSLYATSAVEEDKAEVFAFLMVAPRQVDLITQGDSILRAKVALMKARLSSQLGDDFWQRARALRGTLTLQR